MNFTHKTLDDSAYIIYTVAAGEQIDDLAFRMISNNKINGVFPLNRESEDGQDSFFINVTSRISLKELMNKPFKKEFVLGVLESITQTIIDADEYMLDPGYFLYDFENIYIDLSTKKATLIYLPIIREREDVDGRYLIKKLLFDSRYDESEDCSYVAKLINVINSNEKVSLKKVIEKISEIEKNSYYPQRTPVQQRPEQVQSPASGNNHVPVDIPAEKQQPVQQSASQNAVIDSQPVPQPKPLPTSEPEKKKGGLLDGLFGKKNSKEHVSPQGKHNNAVNRNVGLSTPRGAAIPGRAVPGGVTPGGVTPGGAAIPGRAVPGGVTPGGAAIPGTAAPGGKPAEAQDRAPQNIAPQNIAPADQASAPAPLDNGTGNTIIIGGAAGIGNTVMINRNATNAVARIKRVKNNEEILINNSTFRIGKEKDYVDYCIRDNNTVSRLHAQIEKIDGVYYLRDMNSLNHTYLGTDLTNPMQAAQYYELRNGQHFFISDEEFIFLLR